MKTSIIKYLFFFAVLLLTQPESYGNEDELRYDIRKYVFDRPKRKLKIVNHLELNAGSKGATQAASSFSDDELSLSSSPSLIAPNPDPTLIQESESNSNQSSKQEPTELKIIINGNNSPVPERIERTRSQSDSQVPKNGAIHREKKRTTSKPIDIPNNRALLTTAQSEGTPTTEEMGYFDSLNQASNNIPKKPSAYHFPLPKQVLLPRLRLNNKRPSNSLKRVQSSPSSTSFEAYYVNTTTSMSEKSLPLPSFKEQLLTKELNHFFIVPGLAIYFFLATLEKLSKAPDSEQKNIYSTLKNLLFCKTIKKTANEDTNAVEYNLTTFARSSINVNELYDHYIDMLLPTKEPALIECFLTHGLALHLQNELFCETQRKESCGFLNAVLAHTLILYGQTIELLEHFYNSKEEPTVSTIQSTEIKNKDYIKGIAEQINKYNPLSNKNSLMQKLYGLTEEKIRGLITFYNKQMLKDSAKCIQMGDSNAPTIATQYANMFLNATEHDYSQMTKRALELYSPEKE